MIALFNARELIILYDVANILQRPVLQTFFCIKKTQTKVYDT